MGKTIHSDVRVAAFLRALAVVGMYSGLTAFVIGVNPLITPHVVEAVGHSGNTIGMIGMAGLFVHVASIGYYLATEPEHLDDGLIRY
ncbi:MAG: hypothetical protein V5A34_07920 [Halapricum sp.]